VCAWLVPVAGARSSPKRMSEEYLLACFDITANSQCD